MRPISTSTWKRRCKARGIKTVHFVCPSIWAWRPERVEKIRRAADHVLCIFPFEPELLAQHGIAATYVGHPLANVIPMAAGPGPPPARALGLREDDEVRGHPAGQPRAPRSSYLAARFFEAAALMQQARPAHPASSRRRCPRLRRASRGGGRRGRPGRGG